MAQQLEMRGWPGLIKVYRSFGRCLFLATGMNVSLALAGDLISGQRIAERWCASCHLVLPQQSTASADVPSFQTIARTHNLDDRMLKTFLADPHPKMPDMQLSRSEIDDVVSYIRSLR